MNYPADFDSPTFPAGRKVVSSRIMGIVIMVVFLLIMITTGLLIWAQQSIKTHPFLVSINDITGQWTIVGHDHEQMVTLSAAQSMQESVLTRFIQYWFWISASDIANSARWRECDLVSDCGLATEKKGIDIEGDCAIYCLTGNGLYSEFSQKVLPNYQIIKDQGNTWMVDESTLVLTPIGTIGNNGGVWQVRVTVYQNDRDAIEVLGYARIGHTKGEYQKNLGYHVVEFNAYKMN